MLNSDTLYENPSGLSCPLTLVGAPTPVSKALTLTLGETELGSQKLLPLNPGVRICWKGMVLLYIPQRTQWLSPWQPCPTGRSYLGIEDEMVAPQHVGPPGTCECDLIWKKGLHSCD